MLFKLWVLGEVRGWGGTGYRQKVCGLKTLSVKDAAPIIDRIGKILPQRYGFPEAINQWILKMTAMMLGEKVLLIKKGE